MNTSDRSLPTCPDFEPLPDPWLINGQPASPGYAAPPWQFPLDPSHELPGREAPATLITGGPVGAPLLTTSLPPVISVVGFLLQEELKLPEWPSGGFNEGMQAAIAWLLGTTEPITLAEG